MTTLNVSVTPELADFVNEKVTSGIYPSASEVVGASLRLFKEQEELRRVREEELRKEIAIGTEQLERGEGTVYASAKEFADKIKAEGRKRVAAQKMAEA